VKYSLLYCIIALSLASCNFNKPQSNELVSLTDDVMKHKEGVEIIVEPIQKDPREDFEDKMQKILDPLKTKRRNR